MKWDFNDVMTELNEYQSGKGELASSGLSQCQYDYLTKYYQRSGVDGMRHNPD